MPNTEMVLPVVLAAIFATTIIIIIFFTRDKQAVAPVVLVSATGRDAITDVCGNTNVLFTNLADDMTVNLQVHNIGDCQVTFNTKANPGFLSVRNLTPNRGATALPLKTNDMISYTCTKDEAPIPDCKFEATLTRI